MKFNPKRNQHSIEYRKSPSRFHYVEEKKEKSKLKETMKEQGGSMKIRYSRSQVNELFQEGRCDYRVACTLDLAMWRPLVTLIRAVSVKNWG